MTVLTPVIFVVNQLSFLVLKLLRVDVKAKGESITEDELRTIVEVSHEEGVIESEEKKMITMCLISGMPWRAMSCFRRST